VIGLKTGDLPDHPDFVVGGSHFIPSPYFFFVAEAASEVQPAAAAAY
jgi:hypothetical protein